MSRAGKPSAGGSAGLFVACALVLAVSGPARGEVVSMEALGVVPAGESAPAGRSLRQAALRAGVADAVTRAAVALAARNDSFVDPEVVAEALRGNPMSFTTRFRLVEDRGERPALLVTQPGVETEYVVLVEADIDLDRVRARLVERGLLVFEPTRNSKRRVSIRFSGVGRHATWERIRAAIAAQARGVWPREFTRGEVLVEIETDRSASAVLSAMSSQLGDSLSLGVPVYDAGGLRVEVFERGLGATGPGRDRPAGSSPSRPGPAAIDEARRNRY